MSPERLERKRAYNREYMRERKRRGLGGNGRNGSHARKFCECGNIAEVICGNVKICRRCHQLENERKYDR